MSYCRWSSNDYQCDVYVYQHYLGGWTTHIANFRNVFKDPLPPPIDFHADMMGYVERMRQVVHMVEKADRVPIGLPFDGDTLTSPTALECALLLKKLRDLGYLVPQDAIDQLEKEGNEGEEEHPTD